jgi:hypothetical protein
MNAIIRRCATLGLAAAGLVILASGCLPDDMPGYTDGGKTVVCMDGRGDGTLWTYDVVGGKAVALKMPDKGTPSYARLMGDDVWVETRQIGEKDTQATYACRRFDAAKGEFAETPVALKKGGLLKNFVPASWEGKKCCFAYASGEMCGGGEGQVKYTVYSYPDFVKQDKEVALDGVLPAGGFWWVSVRVRAAVGKPTEIDNVDVYDPEAKKVVAISHDEGSKVRWAVSQSNQGYARMSEDRKVLLLAFPDEGDGYNFGVFDVATGKYLWGGQAKNPVKGHPLVRRDEVWLLVEADEGLLLFRYTPGEKAGVALSEKVMTASLPKGCGAGQYAPSPDGSTFVLMAQGEEGNPSQLLFIPIKKDAKAADVKAVVLK